jgi:DNA-binding transcriptional ArsR family regulator
MPAMSQQLNLLRLEKIVESRRDGQTIYYSLAREDIKKLITFLYTTYCNPLS